MKMLKIAIVLAVAHLFAPVAMAQDAPADQNMSWRALAAFGGLYFHPEGSEAAKAPVQKQAKSEIKK